MLELKGKYNTAIAMVDHIEHTAISQIIQLCSLDTFKESKIRIMADCHAGKGCVVGLTATMEDRVIPNLVGVDISCTVSARKLNTSDIDYSKLDKVIREYIPSGADVRKDISSMVSKEMAELISEVCDCIGDSKSLTRHLRSLGTLGGGNHFISIEGNEYGKWLLIHCGSRNFGHKICTYHQEQAEKQHSLRVELMRAGVASVPNSEKETYLRSLDKYKLPKEFKYLDGAAMQAYILDCKIAGYFAELNHKIIAHEIMSRMGWEAEDNITTNHNYIEKLEASKVMIRKGAVSAKKGERFLVPLNMEAGTLVCIGKGNEYWNCSAPHGAGRVMSRGDAKRNLSLDEYKEAMKGIWSTSVCYSTLDESPASYKDPSIIESAITETAEVLSHLKPFYNYKDSKDPKNTNGDEE